MFATLPTVLLFVAAWLAIPPISAAEIASETLALADTGTSPTFRSVVLATRHDLLSRIARRHGCDAESLLRLNPGVSPRYLHEGQALLVESPLAAPPAYPDLSRELARGVRGRRHIAVTIDAAWASPEQVEAMLSTVGDLGIPATFFLTGIFIEEHPDAVRRIAREGYALGNHSWSHPHCLQVGDEAIRRELLQVEDAVTSLTSATRSTRPWWRPPFGERDERVLQAAAAAGFRSVYWTIDSLDWLRGDDPATVDTIVHRVCERPFERAEHDPDPLDGAIILFHMDGEPTPEALRRMVPRLREAGYSFVDVEALLTP